MNKSKLSNENAYTYPYMKQTFQNKQSQNLPFSKRKICTHLARNKLRATQTNAVGHVLAVGCTSGAVEQIETAAAVLALVLAAAHKAQSNRGRLESVLTGAARFGEAAAMAKAVDNLTGGKMNKKKWFKKKKLVFSFVR